MPGYHWLPDPLKRHLLDREGRRDALRLADRLDGLPAARERTPERLPELRDAWDDYLEREGTDPVMALSLRTARFTLALCDVLLGEDAPDRSGPGQDAPGRGRASVADLGSGFSSWLLRWWAERAGADLRVVSVDDDPGWLARSRSFVEDRGLGGGEFLPWRVFRTAEERFDLLLWDFSDVRTRAAETDAVAGRLAPGGALLFDDIHKARLWRAARRARRRHGLEGYSLRTWTLDEHGRYAWLALDGDRASGAHPISS